MGSISSNKIIRRRLAGAWLSTLISISLVLLLVGLASLLLVNAKSVSDYLKEHIQIAVLLVDKADEKDAEGLRAALEKLPFIKGTELVSREQGAREMAAMLGEDFLGVFEVSPIPVSLNISLAADYVQPDSLAKVQKRLSGSPLVDEVVYQPSLVEKLNANIRSISLALGALILLLLFISFVLINNTVRLNIFSKRFTIHTMRLVGATKGFIRGPFLLGALLQGLLAALLAIAALLGLLLLLRREAPQLFEIFSLKLLLTVAGIIVAFGALLCLASTWFAVGRLVGLSKDELYS